MKKVPQSPETATAKSSFYVLLNNFNTHFVPRQIYFFLLTKIP